MLKAPVNYGEFYLIFFRLPPSKPSIIKHKTIHFYSQNTHCRPLQAVSLRSNVKSLVRIWPATSWCGNLSKCRETQQNIQKLFERKSLDCVHGIMASRKCWTENASLNSALNTYWTESESIEKHQWKDTDCSLWKMNWKLFISEEGAQLHISSFKVPITRTIDSDCTY